MRNYYTVFDFNQNSVRLAPNKANDWADSNSVTTHLSGIVIVLIVVGCLLVLLVISLLVYRCYKQKKAQSKTIGARAEALNYTKTYDSDYLANPIN